jgi:cell shape-determining protein MreD
MNRVTLIMLFLVTWLSVFAQTQFSGLRQWLAVPMALSPALICYAALTHGFGITVFLAVLSGLWADCLSASPLGISVMPLFLLGFTLQLQRHLILRDQGFAQFWIGFGAGAGVPLLTLGVLSLTDSQPVTGRFTFVQLLLLGLLNGIACPILFRMFDWLHRIFDYRPLTTSSFRADRETVRGRQFRLR